MRYTKVITIGALLVLATSLLPAVSATHRELRQQESYVVGGDFLVLCGPLGLDVNLGGVCFELDGRETEIGIHVQDGVQSEVQQADNTVDGIVQDNVANLDAASFGFVEAYYQIVDADGNVLAEDIFCGSANDVTVPEGGTEVLVFLDGAVLGNRLFDRPHPSSGNSPSTTSFDRCDTTYEGATVGTVFLTVPVDH